jgi:cytochrome c oxidase cbb3-type subunit 3
MNQAPENPREPRLLDHDVDGIHEYDNPMPRWWLYILYATVIYSLLYAFNVVPGIGSGRGRIARYERDVADARARKEALAARQGPLTAADVVAIAGDPVRLAQGHAKFQNTCSPCHRADAGGLIGPNLTDDYWIHGGQPHQILKTVSEGVVEKGMPAWSEALNRDELAAVVGYCLTLHGTQPPNPKEPQGEKMKVEPAAAAPSGGR